MKSVLALDQGTTGSTALVVGEDGTILGRGYQEFAQHFPQPGWVEHDAEEIWRVTLDVARQAIRESGATPEAIGITNQRETVVVWDRKTGRPLHRALVWQDRRTAERCRELQDELGDEFLGERTGLVWDPYFSGTKIEWLLQHVPGLAERAQAGEAVFGTIDAWLVFRLTSGASFVTDHTNASRTLLYNLTTHDWDQDLLELFGVPRESLPTTCRSSEVIGVADGAHFGSEIPVAGIAGDQQAALYGQACWEAGQAKCTYGTGAFLLMNVGADRDTIGRSTRGLLTSVCCDALGGMAYALEGSIFIAGAAIQWLRDGLGLIERASESEVLAHSIPDNGGVYFVPALVGLGAPHWEPEARGTIVGITRGTTKNHLVRAALEAMAYGTRDVLEAMAEVSQISSAELKVDGGAAANDWLMQFLADLLGEAVARPDVVETTALGAAGLAGLAVGVWGSPQENAGSRSYRRFQVAGDAGEGYAGWVRAIETALYWAGRRP
jgi:glycerol kinase